MKVSVRKGNLADTESQAVILALFEGKKPAGAALEIDKKTNGSIAELVDSHDFEGKPSQIAVIYTRGLLPAKRIALVGLGKEGEFDLEKLRTAFARVMQHLRSLNIKEAATSLDSGLIPGGTDKVAQAVVEGALLGLYRYAPFKTVDREDLKSMEQLNIVAGENDFSLIESEVEKTRAITEAVYFTRDLVSAPGNEMTPTILAKEAERIAGRNNISCTVLDKAEMKQIGMNLLLGVASGSSQEPKFIILEYTGSETDAPPIVLVGKGLTFDTGGICIKPSDKMDEQKQDMAGGASVIGTIMAAAELRLPLNVVGLIPATENMPGGTALKPGDVIKSYSGKTVEVINTDAEGRLILADALAYASRYKPAAIIDVATLTGACVIALGEELIGMFGNDDALKGELSRAARETGEALWELPLPESYHERIKSDIADYKNYGGRMAGAITASAFLSKFAGDSPWVHLDIAGPAWADKDRTYIPKGASGVPVRLLVEFLRNRAGEQVSGTAS